MSNTQTNIILASASPRRKELMELLKRPFTVVPSEVDEKIEKIEDAASAALLKAKWVQERHPDAIVIGADTIVVNNQRILGKPKNIKEARAMVTGLTSHTHSVYTGIAVVHKDKKEVGLIESKVTVYPMTNIEIDDYLESEDVLDAAGAYKIQGSFARFVKQIDGDYYNVVGLPVHWLYLALKNF